MSRHHRPLLLLALFALLASTHSVLAQGLDPAPGSDAPADNPTPVLTLTPEPGDGPVIPPVPPGCSGAIVDDDGSVEAGYGWVPTVVEGIYVQQYQADEVPSGILNTACVCWLRTRMDDTIDFEVVVYAHNSSEESPEKDPIAVIPSQLAGVPDGVPGATFTEVPLGEVHLPSEGPFYVGVRWDPSADDFFFACVDKTDRPEPPTRVFYRDDRFVPAGWGVSDMTNDSTFNNHRAMFFRIVPDPDEGTQLVEVPLGGLVSVSLIVALLLAGGLLLRRS